MNPLRRLDVLLRRHPVRTDVAATAALFLLFGAVPWITLATPTTQSGTDVLVLAVVTAGMILPWALRRVRPVLSAGLVVLFALVHLVVGPEITGALILVPLTVYNLAAHAPRWASLAGLAVGVFGGIANGVKVWLFPSTRFSPESTMIRSPPTPEAFVFMTLMCGLTVLTAWAFGDVVRNRRLALRALEDRARRLEVQALQERELAAADERNHIAREMHDIVAHSLQVIISQSDGARYAAAARPELAVATLETIGLTGRSALADMRQLLGVLRDAGETVPGVPASTEEPVDARAPAVPSDLDGSAAAGSSTAARTRAVPAGPDRRAPEGRLGHRPQPRLEDLPALLETVRLSGLEVSLLESGTPRRALPAGGELTAYRIAQEALTNTLRHGGPAVQAFVTLTWQPRGLDLQIDDDGRGVSADPATRGSGQGLRGMAERAALFGGTVQSGPRVGAGFRVSAHLPYSDV